MAKITFERLDKMKARIADSKAQLEATALAYAEICNDYQLAIGNCKVYEVAVAAAKDALEGAEGAEFTALQTCVAGLAAAYDAAFDELCLATNEKREAAKLLNAAQSTYARHNASFFVGLMTLPSAIDEYLGNGADGPADDESAPSEDWNDEALDNAADAHAFNSAEADAENAAWLARLDADETAKAAEASAAANTARIAAADAAAGAPVSAAVFQTHADWLARIDEAAEAFDKNEIDNQAAGWPPSTDNN